MLGGGHNLLVRDDPIPGAVLRLAAPAFSWIEGKGRTVRAAGGGPLFELIAHTVKAGLTGLETLVGIRGTVGGSVRCNVGDRTGEIGSAVRKLALLQDDGTEQVRSREEIEFGEHSTALDEPVILWVEFELEEDSPESMLKRMRKSWISRKANEPPSYLPSVQMFANPTGQSARELIEFTKLGRTRVGSAEVSDRNGNYAVAHPGTTAKDILELIATVQERVQVNTGIQLEQALHVW